jgi:molecular chaperone HtpG
LHAANAEDPALDDFANILFGYALLAEGSEMPEPQKFNESLLRVVTKAI